MIKIAVNQSGSISMVPLNGAQVRTKTGWTPIKSTDKIYLNGQWYKVGEETSAVLRITGAGTSEVNGDYWVVPESQWNSYINAEWLAAHTSLPVNVWTNGVAVLEGNATEPYIYLANTVYDYTEHPPLYAGMVSTNPRDPLTTTVWLQLSGKTPLPTLTAI